MNFGTLKSRILETIGRAPNAMVYDLVTADINQRMRLAVMEATTTLVEAASVSLPSGFLEVVSIYRDTNPRTALRPASPQTTNRTYITSGTPQTYAIVDDAGTKKLILNPAPNGSENIELRYYAALSDLSADSDENDVLTTYPAIYLYGALTHHALITRDVEKAQGWGAVYREAMEQAERDDTNRRYSGTPVVPRATVA